jgi:hypothetical protein
MWRNAYWMICGGYLLSWKRSERYKVARINKEYESVYMNNESEEREREYERLYSYGEGIKKVSTAKLKQRKALNT